MTWKNNGECSPFVSGFVFHVRFPRISNLAFNIRLMQTSLMLGKKPRFDLDVHHLYVDWHVRHICDHMCLHQRPIPHPTSIECGSQAKRRRLRQACGDMLKLLKVRWKVRYHWCSMWCRTFQRQFRRLLGYTKHRRLTPSRRQVVLFQKEIGIAGISWWYHGH